MKVEARPERSGPAPRRSRKAAAPDAALPEAVRQVLRGVLTGGEAVDRVTVGRSDDASEREADAAARRASAEGSAPAPAQRQVQGGTKPLGRTLRSRLERSLGAALPEVRVHDDAASHSASRALGARAFSTGRDIWLGAGESANDLALMAHEATHVVQQVRAGPGAGPTLRRKEGEAPAEKPRGSAEMLHITGEELARVINIRFSRSVEDWRSFLKGADNWDRALELNVFLALATGHTDYIQTGDETVERRPPREPVPNYPTIGPPRPAGGPAKPVSVSLRDLRREQIKGLPRPDAAACTRLMIALLSTRDIDLREIGVLSPALGYLLGRFVTTYYPAAMKQVAKDVGRAGSVASSQIDPSAIDDFLGQAEASFSDTRDLEEKRRTTLGRGGAPYTSVTPSRLGEIGVAGAKAGPSPTERLQASALAGAQLAATAAIGAAADPQRKEAWGGIAERFKREIAQHARVLSGIASRNDRLAAIEKAIIEITFAAFSAGIGALANELRAFGAARKATLNLPPAVYVAAAVDAAQAGTSNISSSLAGLSGSALRSAFKEQFAVTVQEKVNMVRDQLSGEQLNAVVAVAAVLEGAFLYQVGG
ncbi:MAG: DUF4157 domain-containing protein [Rubrivivax sp.]